MTDRDEVGGGGDASRHRGATLKPAVLGCLIGLLYCLVARYASEFVSDYPVMSLSFLVLTPFALGVITVWSIEPISWVARVFMPWVPTISGAIVAGIVHLEGTICIVLGLPILLASASLGGIAEAAFRRAREPGPRAWSTLAVVAVLPFVTGPLEGLVPATEHLRTVRSEIVIQADAHRVWDSIVIVPPIEDHELPSRFIYAVGFPKPIEATLTRSGVGGVRHATFEGGVLFVETITDWEPDRSLRFTFKASTDEIPRTTLDEHVTVGGPYFDVLEGEYRIVPAGPGATRLELTSTHRLSTHFDFYAGMWSDAVMEGIQESILEVIKARCERPPVR